MKKVALSLLAFTLVAALAVAQDAPTLKLSGYLNTGAKVTTNDGTTQTIYGDDAGNNWGRLDVNGSYGTATNGVEWSLRTPDSATAPKINYAYAWSKFVDGMVTVKAGHVDDGMFTTASDIGADFTDANSILVAVTPVAGFNAGASWFLPAQVGRARFMALTLLGDRLSAAQAAQWGLIWACVDDAALLDEALKLARRLAAAPAHAALETRRATDAARTQDLSAQLTYEAARQRELIDADSFSEGVSAFMQRRDPAFAPR